jgi:hypothetical protein
MFLFTTSTAEIAALGGGVSAARAIDMDTASVKLTANNFRNMWPSFLSGDETGFARSQQSEMWFFSSLRKSQ